MPVARVYKRGLFTKCQPFVPSLRSRRWPSEVCPQSACLLRTISEVLVNLRDAECSRWWYPDWLLL